MHDLTTIRCSSLPEAFLCAGSVRPANILIDPINGAADEGTAAHEVMAMIAGRDITSMREIDIDGIAKRWKVDPDELARLSWRGMKCWREPNENGETLRDAFRGAQAEVRLVTHVAGVELTGRMDLLGLYPALGLARVLDWKGGRVDRDYSAQVFGYGVLVLMNHPQIDRVDVSIVWLREGEIEPYVITRADLRAWIERLRAEVVEWDRVYRPGRQCEHCARSHACDALIAQGRRDLAMLGGIDSELQAWPAEKIAEVHRRAQTLGRFIESFHQLVKLEVIRRGGEMPAGEGKVLAIKSSFQREIDPLRAWETLNARLTEEELASAIRLRIGEVDDIVAKKAGKGNGAAAKRALAEDLEREDAIKLVEIRQLREVRKP